MNMAPEGRGGKARRVAPRAPRRVSFALLSELGRRHAVTETNCTRISSRGASGARHLCRRHAIAIANAARVGDFLRRPAYDGLLFALHVLLLVCVLVEISMALPLLRWCERD